MTRPARPARSHSPLLTAAAWITAAAVIVARSGEPADAAVALSPVVVVAKAADSIPTPLPPIPPSLMPAASAAPTVAAAPAARPARRRAAPKPFAPKVRSAADSAARTSRYLAAKLRSPRILVPKLPAIRGLMTRAKPGEPVHVTLTAYCLKGTTRRGLPVREGIVAADPRVFPLARHVEIYSDGRFLGRFLVDDTGGVVKGTIIDIWTPSCEDARRFGRRTGTASLVAIGTK